MSIYKYVWCDSLSNRCGVRVSHETCVKFVTRCLIHMSHTHIAVSFICLTHICVESVTCCLIYMCVRGCDVLTTHTHHTHNKIILCMTYVLLSYSSHTHIRLVAHPSKITCVMRACAGYDVCGECVWWKTSPIRLAHHTHVQRITHTSNASHTRLLHHTHVYDESHHPNTYHTHGTHHTHSSHTYVQTCHTHVWQDVTSHVHQNALLWEWVTNSTHLCDNGSRDTYRCTCMPSTRAMTWRFTHVWEWVTNSTHTSDNGSGDTYRCICMPFTST